MLNILWLASWYPCRVNHFNGDFIERHAIAVSAFVKLTILLVIKDPALKDGEVEVEKTNAENLTTYRVFYGPSSLSGTLEKILSFRKYLQLQKHYFKKIEDEHGRPDIVHVQVAMKAGMLARWLRKRRAIPFLVTEHWSGYNPVSRPNIYEANWLFRQLNKKILAEAALVLPVSSDLGKTINRHFLECRWLAVPNVVNTSLFFYGLSKIPLAKFRFIHPSLMNYQKNPEGILMAAKIVKAKGYDFELMMIGGKDESLLSLVDQNGLCEQVIFEGPVPYHEVARQMQLASALLLFSRYENLPCVLLEALCCGLPVVSSRVGGIDEVINEDNGLLVQSENVEELAAAMIDLLNNYSRYDRSTIARDATARFNYTVVGKTYLDIYQDQIQRAKT